MIGFCEMKGLESKDKLWMSTGRFGYGDKK